MKNQTKPYITEVKICEMEAKEDTIKATYRRRQRIYEEIEQGGSMYAPIM